MLLRNLQGGHFYWDTVYIPFRQTTDDVDRQAATDGRNIVA